MRPMIVWISVAAMLGPLAMVVVAAPLAMRAVRGEPKIEAPAIRSVGNAESTTIPCTSAAAVAIAPPSGKTIVSYDCQNTSTTKVAVGSSSISDPGTTHDANIYCATNCPAQEWGGGVRGEYCRGDSDTTITCRFVVAQ